MCKSAAKPEGVIARSHSRDILKGRECKAVKRTSLQHLRRYGPSENTAEGRCEALDMILVVRAKFEFRKNFAFRNRDTACVT